MKDSNPARSQSALAANRAGEQDLLELTRFADENSGTGFFIFSGGGGGSSNSNCNCNSCNSCETDSP